MGVYIVYWFLHILAKIKNENNSSVQAYRIREVGELHLSQNAYIA